MNLKEVLPVLFVVKEDFVERMALIAKAYGLEPVVKAIEIEPNKKVEKAIKRLLWSKFNHVDADVEIETICKAKGFPHPEIGYFVAFDREGFVVAFIDVWIRYSGPTHEVGSIVLNFVYLNREKML